MSVLINDTGIIADDWKREILDWDVLSSSGFEPEAGYGLDLPNTVAPEQLRPYLDTAGMICISFPSAADGRGFTIARQLRLMGYQGRLRARGFVISDQYAMARRSGFDEVETHDTVAARQPAEEWLFRADWQQHDYQTRLRTG